jgi:hypothetical protein
MADPGAPDHRPAKRTKRLHQDGPINGPSRASSSMTTAPSLAMNFLSLEPPTNWVPDNGQPAFNSTGPWQPSPQPPPQQSSVVDSPSHSDTSRRTIRELVTPIAELSGEKTVFCFVCERVGQMPGSSLYSVPLVFCIHIYMQGSAAFILSLKHGGMPLPGLARHGVDCMALQTVLRKETTMGNVNTSQPHPSLPSSLAQLMSTLSFCPDRLPEAHLLGWPTFLPCSLW